MVISTYTYLFVSSQNKYLAYNSRSNSFVELSERLFNHLKSAQTTPSLLEEINTDVLDLLYKHKIIVEDDEDIRFITDLQFKTLRTTFSQSTIGLTIAPANDCNFRCFYCFEENKAPVTMTDKTIDDLIAFINKHVFAKKLAITWYGGEPLLAFKQIKTILSKIEALPLQLINHRMITNGYYFDQNVIDYFKEHKLNSVQITLDGKKERHNKIRKDYKSKAPSFEVILSNIDRILEQMPETRVAIRVNIDKNNSEDYYELLKMLSDRWKDYSNFGIYPGIIRMDNEDRTDLGGEAMCHKDVSDFLFHLGQKEDFNIRYFPTPLLKVCAATSINSYIIGAKGEIYKCWNDLTDRDKVIGYLDKADFANKFLYYDYIIRAKWHEDEKCRQCFFLPLCHGGCAWYKLRNIRKNAHYNVCTLYADDDNLKRCLELYYQQKMQQG